MVTIKSWEIARLFGLVYAGEYGNGGDVDYSYKFSFHGRQIAVIHGWGDDEAADEYEAKEEAANLVLYAVGSIVSCAMKDEF